MVNQSLIIMRHAKSDWTGGQRSDYARPLASRGARNAAAMAQWLGQQEFAPTCIKSSPAVRAAETARIVAKELGGTPIIWESKLYLADLSDLLEIAAHPPSARWLLVGHNPGLESLVRFCDPEIEDRTAHGKLLPTGALYAFVIDTDNEKLSSGCGSLICHQRPKSLD